MEFTALPASAPCASQPSFKETGIPAPQYQETNEIVIAATLWLMHRYQPEYV